jgi:hypothetical protein
MESRWHIPAERLANSGPMTPARGKAAAGVAARVVQPCENAVLHGTSLGRRTDGIAAGMLRSNAQVITATQPPTVI